MNEERLGAILLRAMELFKNGNYKESFIYCEKVLALDSENITAWIMLGQLHEHFEDWSKAIKRKFKKDNYLVYR